MGLPKADWRTPLVVRGCLLGCGNRGPPIWFGADYPRLAGSNRHLAPRTVEARSAKGLDPSAATGPLSGFATLGLANRPSRVEAGPPILHGRKPGLGGSDAPPWASLVTGVARGPSWRVRAGAALRLEPNPPGQVLGFQRRQGNSPPRLALRVRLAILPASRSKPLPSLKA